MKQIFINLPVRDVEQSMKLYTQMGFVVNPLFTFDDKKCMVWSEHIYIMLQKKRNFQEESNNNSSLSFTSNLASFTLPVDSFDTMNGIMENALKAGAKEPTPIHDERYMKLRKLEDFDGHRWDIIYLDMDKFRELKGR